MSKNKIVNGHLLGAIVDFCALTFAVFLFRIHWLLGTIGVVVFFGLTCGVLPGTMFRELDEEPLPTPPQHPKVSPYTHLVGTQAEVVAEIKPQGLVQVGDKRISAKSGLRMIEVGTVVTIVGAELTGFLLETKNGA